MKSIYTIKTWRIFRSLKPRKQMKLPYTTQVREIILFLKYFLEDRSKAKISWNIMDTIINMLIVTSFLYSRNILKGYYFIRIPKTASILRIQNLHSINSHRHGVLEHILDIPRCSASKSRDMHNDNPYLDHNARCGEYKYA